MWLCVLEYVGCECDEVVGCVLVGDCMDVCVYVENFLDDDDGRVFVVFG